MPRSKYDDEKVPFKKIVLDVSVKNTPQNWVLVGIGNYVYCNLYYYYYFNTRTSKKLYRVYFFIICKYKNNGTLLYYYLIPTILETIPWKTSGFLYYVTNSFTFSSSFRHPARLLNLSSPDIAKKIQVFVTLKASSAKVITVRKVL